jgi:hypothetical protein
MMPNESKLILRRLCDQRCLATEIATAIVYSAAICLWMSILVPPDHRDNAKPARRGEPTSSSSESARMHEFTRALAL